MFDNRNGHTRLLVRGPHGHLSATYGLIGDRPASELDKCSSLPMLKGKAEHVARVVLESHITLSFRS